MRTRVAVCFLATVLVGCGDTEEEPAGVIPQHQLDALEEAQALDEVLKEAEALRREQMDESS